MKVDDKPWVDGPPCQRGNRDKHKRWVDTAMSNAAEMRVLTPRLLMEAYRIAESQDVVQRYQMVGEYENETVERLLAEMAVLKAKLQRKTNKHHSYVQKFRALRKKMKEKV